MKHCFVFENNNQANEFAKTLSKELKEHVTCPKNSNFLFVRDKDYKKAITCGTTLLAKDRSNISWVDSEQFTAPIGWVPFIHVEVAPEGLSSDGHWKLPTRRNVKHFMKDLSNLLGKSVFYQHADCGDVRFYITRTPSLEKEHKALRDKYLSHISDSPFESENAFSKIVMCDFYGKPAKIAKNVE